MEKKIFAIYDPDPEFVFRFMEFAKEHSGISMEVKAFTEEESLRQMTGKTAPELLMISSTVLTEEMKSFPSGTKVILLEEPEQKTDDFPCVYKYQPPAELLRKIMKSFSEEQKSDPAQTRTRRGKIKLIGIYSPVGRTRKTSFALALGQILAGYRSVLYLNLEIFAGFEPLFSEQYERTLSDLVYFGRQEQADLQAKLPGIIRSIRNMDYVPPVFCPDDLQNVKTEEWMELFRKLGEQTHYEILLLDLSEAVLGLMDLLASCDRVYMPVRMDPVSQAKLEQFSWTYAELQGEEAENRIRKIKLPIGRSGKTGRDFFTDLADSELGDFIRKELTDEVNIWKQS